MRPVIGNDNLDKGQQYQLWIAGPNAKGQALLVWANYGTTYSQNYTSPTSSGVREITVSNGLLESLDLHAACYKANNLWNPNDNTNLQNFSSIYTELDDEQVLVMFLTPNELAIHCDVATAKR